MRRQAAQSLPGVAYQFLARALGDTPETVIAVHLLTTGLCRVWAAGPLDQPRAVIVQALDLPEEPTGFGAEAEALWDLLQLVEGWSCVNVAPAVAPALGNLITERTGQPVRFLADIYHVATQPPPAIHHDAVRLLSLDDLDLIQMAPRELRGSGLPSPRALLTDGLIAGGIVDGRLVAAAHTAALSPQHGDIGVGTLPAWRGQGLATAAAALVAGRLQETGRIPVWSCGESNQASRRVAAKIGLREVSRRMYVILDHHPT